MKAIKETDWHVERVQQKAVWLLRYLPRRDGVVKRKRLLGRGKVMSSMPFNILEGIGIVFRLRLFSAFILRLQMLPIVVGWSLGYLSVILGLYVWEWLLKMVGKLVDELEDDDLDIETDIDSEEDVIESARLLS